MSFGPLGSALLKLAAVIVFPSAVAMFIPLPVINMIIMLCLYVGLLVYLFELEVSEAVMLAVIIFLLKLFVGFAIFSLIISAFQ